MRIKIIALTVAAAAVIAGGAFILLREYRLMQIKNHIQLGKTYMNNSDFKGAKNEFEKVLKLDTSNEEAKLSLGRAYELTGYYGQAIKELSPIFDKSPTDYQIKKEISNTYLKWGEELLKDKREGEAEINYRDSLGFNSNNITAYKELAELYIKNEDLDKAQQVLEAGTAATSDGTIKTLLEQVKKMVGNTAGNMINGGIAAVQGEWIYYNNSNTSSVGLYKIKTDNTEQTKICGDDAVDLNIIEDCIYYTCSNEDGIFKIKEDGSGRQKLVSGRYKLYGSVGNYLYYGSDSELYRIKISSSIVEKISSDVSWNNININTDQIYYSKGSKGLYIMNKNGSNKTKLSDLSIDKIALYDNYMYFTDDYNMDYSKIPYIRLHKIELDGSNKAETIGDAGIYNFNIQDGWIYYIQIFSNTSTQYMMKMKLDGSSKQKLNEFNYEVHSVDINLAGDWIFYRITKVGPEDSPQSEAELQSTYKMKLDGSENQQVD